MSDVKRPYVAPVRVEQAAETRRRVLQAATVAFAAGGWAGTTLADVARAAGVTPQAVHLSVGAKPELLIAAVGHAVGGDTPDVPLMEREPFRGAFADGVALAKRAEAVAAGARGLYERAGPLFLVLVQAAPVNPAVAQLWETARAARLSYCRRLVETVLGRRKKALVDRLTDILFVLSGPRVYADLVVDRQWGAGTYERWLSEMIESTLRDALA
jgi:AcrR family transcriptional regulator